MGEWKTVVGQKRWVIGWIENGCRETGDGLMGGGDIRVEKKKWVNR